MTEERFTSDKFFITTPCLYLANQNIEVLLYIAMN